MPTAILLLLASSFFFINSESNPNSEEEIDLLEISFEEPSKRITFLEEIIQKKKTPNIDGAKILLAKSYIETKEYEKAINILSQEELKKSPISEYSTFYLIEALTKRGNKDFPLELYQYLLTFEKEPSFKKEALSSLANYYHEKEDYNNAFKYFKELIKIEENSENIAKIFEASLKSNNEEASFYGKRLLIDYPLNSTSAEIFKKYSLFFDNLKKSLTGEEKLKRLFNLEEGDGFFSFEKEYPELIPFLNKEEKIYFDSNLLYIQKRYKEAILKLFEIGENSPLFGRSIEKSLKIPYQSISLYHEIEKRIHKVNDSEKKSKFLSTLFQKYRKLNSEHDTVRVAIELLRFSNDEASEYLYKKAYDLIRVNRKKEAKEIFLIMKNNLPPSSDYQQAASFSLYKLSLVPETEKESIKRNLLSNSKYGYYGYTLRGFKFPEKRAMPQITLPYIKDFSSSRIVKASKLIESGLSEEAIRELELLLKEDDRGEYLYYYALISSKGKAYPKSIRALRKLFPYAFTEEGDKLPDDVYKLLYPLPYFKEFRKISQENQIPILLLYSIARQESLFDRKAISRSDARGIIQLLPSTARHTAKIFNIDFKNIEELFDVETNLKIGTKYFLHLYQNFNKNIVYALAGYNAGPNRVKEWKQNSFTNDEEIFIESIPFKETRSYVKRILNNYYEYQRLYPELIE